MTRLHTDTLRKGAIVRSTNDLYKVYGNGRVQKLRNGQAKVEFEPSVFMPPPDQTCGYQRL